MKIPNNWTFRDSNVANNFDTHVREQLPWYDLATSLIKHVGRHYIPQDGVVYDIGASTGNVGNALLPTLAARNAKFIAIENSAEMAKIYKGPETLVLDDAINVSYQKSDFIVCFLVLMFLTPTNRKKLLSKLYKSLNKGGAILIFEKFLPESGYVSIISQRLSLAGKLEAGATPERIIEKELSLSGIQRPLNLNEIPRGASEIFRYGDFAGWIIEKK